MPEIKDAVPVLLGIAIVLFVALGFAWIIDHPAAAIIAGAVIASGIVLLVRRRRARDRV